MRELTLLEIRDLQIRILDTVAKCCEDNGLRYSFAYGSMIGAVRHGGYIPWDDDIDLFMPREDYNKFASLFNGKYGHFRFVSPYTDSKFPYLFAKVEDSSTLFIEQTDYNYPLGVNIDIFPIDGMPENEQESAAMIKKMFRMKLFLNTKSVSLNSNRAFSRNMKLLMGKIALLPFSYRWLIKKYIAKATRYPYETSSCVTDWTFPKPKRRYKKEYFDNTEEILFEGKPYQIVSSYDDVMTRIFGDYMKMPPEEKQVTHHSYKAYIK